LRQEEASIETIGKPVPVARRAPSPVAASAIVHAIALAAIIHHSAPFIAPIRLPGSEHGTNLLLAYLPGRAPAQTTTPDTRTTPKQSDSQSPLPTIAKQKKTSSSPNTQSPVSDHPDSTSGADALGSGNINIALATYFPTPKPDLSTLPSGTRGDVILDVVIDSNGKISDIKMTNGLGHGVDETVIATVQQWTFHPATRDGQPVASEQELHFHYEKA
jgi:protein TonB